MDVHNFLVLIYTFRLCHICVYDILLSNIIKTSEKWNVTDLAMICYTRKQFIIHQLK